LSPAGKDWRESTLRSHTTLISSYTTSPVKRAKFPLACVTGPTAG